jgi:hypothetical protein
VPSPALREVAAMTITPLGCSPKSPQPGRAHFDCAVQGFLPSHGTPQVVQPDPGGLVAGDLKQAQWRQGTGAHLRLVTHYITKNQPAWHTNLLVAAADREENALGPSAGIKQQGGGGARSECGV